VEVGEGVWVGVGESALFFSAAGNSRTSFARCLSLRYPYRSRQLIGRGTVCRAVVMGGVRTKKLATCPLDDIFLSFFVKSQEKAVPSRYLYHKVCICRSLLPTQ
jgi:hypothetical protein